jgi:hypothetical protein
MAVVDFALAQYVMDVAMVSTSTAAVAVILSGGAKNAMNAIADVARANNVQRRK